MFKSMTAYGRATTITPLGRFSVELHSVNRKHLEINTYLPKELLRYDGDIKQWISPQVGRGQINVKISAAFDASSPLIVTPNIALVRQIKNAWDLIAEECALVSDSKTMLNILSQQEGILLYEENIPDEEQYRKVLKDTIFQALQPFLAMKAVEGQFLHQDISARFAKLSPIIQQIAFKSSGATERYRQRLLERLNEVMGGANLENEDKLLREVCVYAERIDITEEITRFQSHLKQIDDLIHPKKEKKDQQGKGKTLEFIVQELNREINTIGSKSSDVEVTKLVIEVKSELERVREQIQNIE